ncbi:MAG: response regulator, partial [Thermoleophilia bacterium]|nr:response regulator [Thermoleophilia bacterium]
MLVALFEGNGFEVRVAEDGETAVELARSFAPDVIVLDVGLGGIDGVEVCRRIRTFSDTYVLMLTARDEEVDRIVGLSVGADDYV